MPQCASRRSTIFARRSFGGCARRRRFEPTTLSSRSSGTSCSARFVRVARLDRAPGAKTREGWQSFFREHFPRGGEHARLLWTDWRNPLLQRGTTGDLVTITHGQPDLHWRLHEAAQGVALVVDLESMWDDFASAVESFVDACAADRPRARRALRRWRAST